MGRAKSQIIKMFDTLPYVANVLYLYCYIFCSSVYIHIVIL